MRSPAATLSAVRCQNVIAVCGAKGSIKLTEAPPLTQLARISLNAGVMENIVTRERAQ